MHRSKLLIRLIGLFAGGLLPVLQVSAAPLKVLGLDDMSCVAWKETASDPERRAAYVQWVRGFLSGHNYANQSKQVAEVSVATVAVFVDRYCSERAASNVADAAMRMSDRYSGRNSPITR